MSPDDDARLTAKFLRGLTIGAIVGAVLAGSSMLTRRQRALQGRRDAAPRTEAPVAPPNPPPTTD